MIETMNRRQFLNQFGIYLAATSTTCVTCRLAFGWLNEIEPLGGESPSWVDTSPQPSIDPESENTPSGSYRLTGCTLSGNFSGPGGFRFLPTTGNPQMDQVIFEEARNLAFITGLQPSLAFLDDRKAPNAFATNRDIINGRSPHGAVALGIAIMAKMYRETGDITAIGAVLVHEWAHIGQFVANVRSNARTVKPTELMADFVAGWYHGFRCALGCQRPDPRFAQYALASVGDYDTNKQGHHGTPEERYNAYLEGYQYVANGGGGGIYGLQQFQQQLMNFGNPYAGGFNSSGGYGGQRTPQFREAFQYAYRKYVG